MKEIEIGYPTKSFKVIKSHQMIQQFKYLVKRENILDKPLSRKRSCKIIYWLGHAYIIKILKNTIA